MTSLEPAGEPAYIGYEIFPRGCSWQAEFAVIQSMNVVEGRYELVSVRRWGSIVATSGHGRILYREPDGSTRLPGTTP